MDAPILSPLGPDGVVVSFADTLTEAANARAQAFARAVEALGQEGVLDVAPALVSTLVRFDPGRIDRATVEAGLEQVLQTEPARAQGRRLAVPTSFEPSDAPDLPGAADAAGLTPEQAIEEIAASPVRVLALGFAPGQPYCGLLPEHWNIPRRAALNPKVPQAALITAVRQLITFANTGPTGWYQIGMTGLICFDPARDPAILLAPGDTLRFEPVTAEALRDAGPGGGIAVT